MQGKLSTPLSYFTVEIYHGAKCRYSRNKSKGDETVTTVTSREFNQDVSAAKRAAEAGPVEITEHGRRSHVLLTADEFDRLARQSEPVGARLFASPDSPDLGLPERRHTSTLRVPEL